MDQDQIVLGSLAVVLGAYYLRRRRHNRRWWVRPINANREEQGGYEHLFREMKLHDKDMFFNTRMTPEQFDMLLEIVWPSLQKRSHRKPIQAEARLALTLRHLAAGDNLSTLAFAYRIGKSTTCCIINETCEAIWSSLHKRVLKEPTEAEWQLISKQFNTVWNLPNCLGAIDGKHVTIRAPSKSGSLYFNYKKSFSIVLFAVSDAQCCFTYVDIGAYGSQSDGAILKESSFGNKLNNNLLKLPENKELPGITSKYPYYFVGDEAFPSQINLMRPYGGRNLSPQERIYNYRLCRARRCVENAFGILIARFRIFHSTIFKDPIYVDRIVKATICLHNFIKKHNDKQPVMDRKYAPTTYADTFQDGQLIPGAWRNG